MRWFQSSGPLQYSRTDDGGYRLVLAVDPGIVSLYRALIPKYHNVQKQAYPPHISIVRHETPNEHWGKYENEVVEFTYGNHIYHDEVYWWLNAYSNRLEEIRLELGLPVDSPYTRPPDGMKRTFHITLGNTKRS